MTTQSNKQTQNVKVVVNNKVGCCNDKKPRRKKPTPRPAPQPVLPIPVMQPWARGLPSQAVRPTIYAPSATMITPDNGLGGIPPYFEQKFTNQQATLEEMRKSIRQQFEDLQYELAARTVNREELEKLSQVVQNAEARAMNDVGLSVQGSSMPFLGGTPTSLSSAPSTFAMDTSRTTGATPPSSTSSSSALSPPNGGGSHSAYYAQPVAPGTSTESGLAMSGYSGFYPQAPPQQQGSAVTPPATSSGGSLNPVPQGGLTSIGSSPTPPVSQSSHSGTSLQRSSSDPTQYSSGMDMLSGVYNPLNAPLPGSSVGSRESDQLFGPEHVEEGIASPPSQIFGESTEGGQAGSRVGNQDHIHGEAGLAQQGSRAEGGNQHPYFSVLDLWMGYGNATTNAERRGLANQIRNIARANNVHPHYQLINIVDTFRQQLENEDA
jgi:hypothetical protein